MKKIYSVKDDFIGMRLDKWIKRNISDIPQSLIEKNIRKGNIKINNKKEKSSYKLKKSTKTPIKNKFLKVYTGQRGGRYIIKKGKKIYQ